MACRLFGAKPYPNQCWHITSYSLCSTFQWNFIWMSKVFTQEHTFENFVCEMAVNFSGLIVLIALWIHSTEDGQHYLYYVPWYSFPSVTRLASHLNRRHLARPTPPHSTQQWADDPFRTSLLRWVLQTQDLVNKLGQWWNIKCPVLHHIVT